MRSKHILSALRHIALGLTVVLATTGMAAAQQMVSVKGSVVNMRDGPGTQTQALWKLKRGYPLKVLERRGQWLKVQDFENDRGWVAASLTGRQPYHIVKAPVANIRSGPSPKHRIVGRVTHGELLKTQEKRAGWVKVKKEEGTSGWVARRLLWGW